MTEFILKRESLNTITDIEMGAQRAVCRVVTQYVVSWLKQRKARTVQPKQRPNRHPDQ